jgi:hypothetical protein
VDVSIPHRQGPFATDVATQDDIRVETLLLAYLG